MDTKAYIESGVIESYVLGLASAEDAAELELLINQHPDIKKAVDDFSFLMEENAFANAVPPPPLVKSRLLAELADEFDDLELTHTLPVVPITTVTEDTGVLKKIRLWQYLAAASVVLFIASSALNFYFYNNYKNSDGKYQALLVERNSLEADNHLYKTKLNVLDDNFNFINDTSVKVIKLKGVKGHENTLATVYWNAKTKDVYLSAKTLPQTATGKQYQLWAIVNGKPVDAGVVDSCEGALCKMKNISGAQAFAITLEKSGGSPTPDLTSLYVIANV